MTVSFFLISWKTLFDLKKIFKSIQNVPQVFTTLFIENNANMIDDDWNTLQTIIPYFKTNKRENIIRISCRKSILKFNADEKYFKKNWEDFFLVSQKLAATILENVIKYFQCHVKNTEISNWLKWVCRNVHCFGQGFSPPQVGIYIYIQWLIIYTLKKSLKYIGRQRFYCPT